MLNKYLSQELMIVIAFIIIESIVPEKDPFDYSTSLFRPTAARNFSISEKFKEIFSFVKETRLIN